MGGLAMHLIDGEREAGPWERLTLPSIVRLLLDRAGHPADRPPIVAVDGRSGSGKTAAAARLATAGPHAAIVHTDDLSWNHAFFAWSDLLENILREVRAGHPVQYRPPAWDRHKRPGAIEVDAGCQLVLIEGVGAARREVADLIDVVVWVQADFEEAERRGIARDGGHAAAVAFWREWMAEETPFLARDRPWERADLVINGTPAMAYDATTELVVAVPAPRDQAT